MSRHTAGSSWPSIASDTDGRHLHCPIGAGAQRSRFTVCCGWCMDTGRHLRHPTRTWNSCASHWCRCAIGHPRGLVSSAMPVSFWIISVKQAFPSSRRVRRMSRHTSVSASSAIDAAAATNRRSSLSGDAATSVHSSRCCGWCNVTGHHLRQPLRLRARGSATNFARASVGG